MDKPSCIVDSLGIKVCLPNKAEPTSKPSETLKPEPSATTTPDPDPLPVEEPVQPTATTVPPQYTPEPEVIVPEMTVTAAPESPKPSAPAQRAELSPSPAEDLPLVLPAPKTHPAFIEASPVPTPTQTLKHSASPSHLVSGTPIQKTPEVIELAEHATRDPWTKMMFLVGGAVLVISSVIMIWMALKVIPQAYRPDHGRRSGHGRRSAARRS